MDVSIAQRLHSFMPSSFIPFCRGESNCKTNFAHSALFESVELERLVIFTFTFNVRIN